MSDNSVVLIGNVTRDPELRFTTGGTAVAEFGLAYNKRWFDQKEQEWKEGETSFFNITAWRDLGEHCAASIVKGQRVIVVASAEQSTWEDNEGNKRSSVRFVAHEVGPSLKWGTTIFEKASRETANGSNQPARSGAASRQPDPVYGDEEPF